MTRPLLALLLLAACGPEPVPSPTPPADSTAAAPARPIGMPDSVAQRLIAEDPLWADALRLHYDAIVVDGHIDTPTLMLDEGYAVAERHATDHVDLPRMEDGGLDAAFFALYVPRALGEGEAATARAEAMLAEVRRQVAATDRARIALTAADVRDAAEAGQAAVLLSVEGGHALQGSAEVLRRLAAQGVRSITLTHTNTNAFADAQGDAVRWGGLNDLGRDLVAEMNRLGVVVDVSHVSDAAFFDAVEASAAPVILSHSSCRAVYGHERNATDAMLRALAANGGVAMINYYDLFVGPDADLDTVLDHIEHAVAVAGADHVGLGSDFDGVPSLPDGLEDATRLPWITHGLLKRGMSEADVRKILGENVLRVLAEAERVAE